MRLSFGARPGGHTGRPVWPALALVAILPFASLAQAQSTMPQNSVLLRPMATTSTTTTVGATIIDRLSVAKYSDVNIGRASIPEGGTATLELRPEGKLIADGHGNPHVEASFSAVFTLTGEPNQTFGISLPHSTSVATGAISQSVRTFLHDAGPTPLVGAGGNGRFNVGAVFSVGRAKTGSSQTEVYIGAVNVIVSNN